MSDPDMEAARARRRCRTATLVALALAVTCAVLAITAWRTAARRSTIPIALDHVVVEKLVRHEKHPGRDDHHVLVLREQGGADLREIEVDRALFGRLAIGQHLSKPSGAGVLDAGGATIQLAPSRHGHALGVAALVAIATLVGLLALSRVRSLSEAP